MKRFLSLFILALSYFMVHSQIVNTQQGYIRGSQNGNVYQFLGVPFAKPPTKELGLRWKAPQDRTAWSDTLSALSFKKPCPQKKFEQSDSTFTIIGEEDCLYLNIWTPQLGTGDKAVMVFIHGGGNQQGSADEVAGGTQLYFGKNLAERGDVVVVTIQYRLGPLGYLVHPGLEAENVNRKSGNYGVMDQIKALRWIKDNISQFGGDPNKVMIFGESAGAVNVGNLLCTPMASGLFQRACMQSGSPVINDYNDSRNKGISYVNKFINTGTDVQKIQHMRTLPSDSLVYFETSPLSGGVAQQNWQPVIDSVIFFDKPINVVQSGNYNKVPLMIGSNSDEMSLSAPLVVTPAMVTALVNASLPPPYRAEALTLYPPGTTNAQARSSYVQLLTDAQFTAPARRTAQCVSNNQTEPVWRYFFTYRHTVAALANFGAYHGMELFYVFNNWENATLGQGLLFKPSDDSLQKVMLRYWVNFAKTGNPNGAGLVTWPTYRSADDCYLEIKATPVGSQCGVRTTESNFWDKVVGFTGCRTSTNIVQQSDWKGKVLVYPNPAMDMVYLHSVNRIQSVELLNVNGQSIRYYDQLQNPVISVKDLKAGIYILRAYFENGQWGVQQLVKQ